jgi:hypothetical protein
MIPSMRTHTLAALCAAALAGCAAPLDAPLSPSLGEAVATLQSQIIPPPAADDRPGESSAARAAAAIARYDNGKVIPPAEASTSAVSLTASSAVSR